MSAIRYLFCINTGRSGSDYLRRIFQHVRGCRAFHEPAPIGNGQVIRDFFAGRDEAVREFTKRKLEAIELARNGQVYFESNHCFIKGFGWFLPELVGEPSLGVVSLHRDSQMIVDSTLRIGSTPLSDFGRHWLITPDAISPRVPPPTLGLLSARSSYRIARACWKFSDWTGTWLRKKNPGDVNTMSLLRRYERQCVEWYVDETSALADEYIEFFPGVRHFKISVDELNDVDGVRRMLEYFGMEALPSMAEVVGRPTNLALQHGHIPARCASNPS